MKSTTDEQLDIFSAMEEGANVKYTAEEIEIEEIKEIEEMLAEELDASEDEMIVTKRGDTFTNLEWESPVVKGGPSRQEIEEWKDKYGPVYFTPFEDQTFIWRTLNRPEYREIIRNNDITMLDREEIMSDKCVLFPRDFTCKEYTFKGYAGVPSLLSEMIMDKSGFVARSAPIKL